MSTEENGHYTTWRPDEKLDFTDEAFIMGKGKSKTVFYVHRKILLCSGSKKFQQMLLGAPDGTESERKIHEDPEAFELLMNFFYSNYDKLTSWIQVCKLCIIGEKYEVPDIRNITNEYMATLPEKCRTPTKITDDVVWEAIENNVFSCSLLSEMQDYLKENAKTLICAEKIFNAPKNFIYEILLMDDLNMNECDLLAAVTEWGYRNINPVNFENFKRFYKHIRFGAMKFDEFLHFRECFSKAMDDKNTQDIAEYLYSTSVRNLPEWCSSNHVLRKNEFNLQKRLKLEDEQNDDNSIEMCEQNDDKSNYEYEQNDNVKEESQQNDSNVKEDCGENDDNLNKELEQKEEGEKKEHEQKYVVKTESK